MKAVQDLKDMQNKDEVEDFPSVVDRRKKHKKVANEGEE